VFAVQLAKHFGAHVLGKAGFPRSVHALKSGGRYVHRDRATI
jgi:hypothetical protein